MTEQNKNPNKLWNETPSSSSANGRCELHLRRGRRVLAQERVLLRRPRVPEVPGADKGLHVPRRRQQAAERGKDARPLLQGGGRKSDP